MRQEGILIAQKQRKGKMRDKFLRLSIVMSVFFICGCVTASYERSLGEKSTPKSIGVFDFSTGNDIAMLLIKARPPSQQMMIEYYQVILDNHEPFLISKHSDNEIKLDAGQHSIEIRSVGGKTNPIGNNFGKPSSKTLTLSKNDWLTLEYVGPYWMWGQGQLKESY